MKTFFRKLKKSNKILLVYYIFLILAFLISFTLLTLNLIKLTGIETIVRVIFIIIFYLIWLVYILCGAYQLITRKHKSFITVAIIITLFIPLFSIGSYFIDKTYNSLSGLVESDYVTYTSNLVILKNKDINKDSKIAIISDKDDIEGYILGKKLLEKEKLNQNELIKYDDYFEMIRDLYEETIDGILISSNYITLFNSIEAYENIANETYVIYKYSEKMKNQDTGLTTHKKITEPFTVLLMGVDGTGDGLNPNQAFNGDTLMLISVNPKTLNATIFSVPRDTYVPIACANNGYAKINSSAARGTSCVISTVEQLVDVKIDYYVKINFKGVVDLVEAVGGITVDIEEPDYNTNQGIDCKKMVCEQNSLRQFGKDIIYIKPGIQKLNGEQALAYARNRHQYLQSDIARNKHQQQVVEAILQETKNIKSLSDFQKILTAIEKNIDTNMSVETILSFYNVGKDVLGKILKKQNDFLSIEKTYMEYYSLPVYIPRAGSYTSAIGYYSESLEAIKKALKVTLEKEKQELIKTFSYKYGEEYEIKPIGAGLRKGIALETLPSFIGKDRSEINNYCSSHNIACDFKEVTATGVDLFYPNGYITTQSIHQGVLVKEIKSITFSVNKVIDNKPPINNGNNNCDPSDINCNNNPLNPNTETPNENPD